MRNEQNVSFKTKLGRTIRQNHLFWRYVANLKPWLQYRLSNKSITEAQKAVLANLKRDGVAITTAKDLMGDTAPFEELEAAILKIKEEMSSQIEESRHRVNDPKFKSYLIEYLAAHPVLDPESIFVRFALHPAVLNLANGYFGMYTNLRAFNVWHTFPSAADARNSQLWHRDPEDRYILKMFVYMSDVDEGSGPLSYAPGTHGYGKIKTQPETFGEPESTARRSNDEQMKVVVPKEKWITALGSKGSIVFADTRGYHKGGWARKRDRLLYHCMFTSRAATRDEYFVRKAQIRFDSYDYATRFALGG